MCSNSDEEFPFDIEDVSTELNGELLKYFKGERDGFVRVGPKAYLLPRKYKEVARDIFRMPLRETDVFVVGFPRSGTNWTQELVWLIVNNLDYETANSTSIWLRYYVMNFLYNMHHPDVQEEFREKNRNNGRNLAVLEYFINSDPGILAKMPSPRFLKFHMSMSLLPSKVLDTAKVVYVARDPRDVAVSGYYFSSIYHPMQFAGDLKQYWELFISDRVFWAPYFEHLKEAWELKHHPNMLFVFYEDMVKDLPGMVRRVSHFFNKQYSEEQVRQLCYHLSLENAKRNKQVNGQLGRDLGIYLPNYGIVRKGKVGGWREHFDAEMRAQAAEWIARNLRGTDLRFPSMDCDAI